MVANEEMDTTDREIEETPIERGDVDPTEREMDETRKRPSIREFIANHPSAESRLYREAEAMEFDPTEVYDALERVQEEYDPFAGAKIRHIYGHGDNYVAFELNGGDWYHLFDFLKTEINDEEKPGYIATVITKLMSDITGEDRRSQTALPLVLSESEIPDVLAYHEEKFEPESRISE